MNEWMNESNESTNPWTNESLNLNESQWISMNSINRNESQRIAIQLNKSQWISIILMNLNGSQWISINLNRSQWISIDHRIDGSNGAMAKWINESMNKKINWSIDQW